MIISSDLDFFQTVYLVTDPEQRPRLVTEVKMYPGPVIMFQLSSGTSFSIHYREEISTERQIILE